MIRQNSGPLIRGRAVVVGRIVNARRNGATLRAAAAAGGIHVATLCRWAAREPVLADLLEDARRHFRRWHLVAGKAEHRRVRWRADCPRCKARVVVRCARGRACFWRCGT